jgi:Na+/H+-dicarboxylate symporter
MINETENYSSSDTAPKAEASSPHRIKWLLPAILLAIFTGVILGGWFPELAVRTSLLGEIFLNSLMMLVVPLVMLSMIVGITRLENIRNLGSLGGKTMVYYLTTTSVSVIIGILLVNLVQPGKGISPGENHPEISYEVSGPNLRTIRIKDTTWMRKSYSNRFQLVLLDQKVRGSIHSITDSTIRINFWEELNGKNKIYIHSEDGRRIPFERTGNQLISAEPQIKVQGTGVAIQLSTLGQIAAEKQMPLSETFRQLLVGNPEKNQQGLIPRNIFMAMVKMDVLPLIIFSLLLGAALSVLGSSAAPTIRLIGTLNDAVMQLVHWVMYVSPIGIFGLVAARIGNAGGFQEFLPELLSLGKYSFTVLLGLLIHGLIVLSLLLRIWGRQKPLSYLKGVATALLNAFSTASSTATLPLTIQGVEEENGVSNRTASFVLPLGATINMDGTALYEAVAAIFIAQVYGIELSTVHMIIIFLTATLAAIGAAGIPEAGLVTMVIVLKAVNLPLEGIGLLLTIDWLLDRFRTTINVWGDSVGAAIIDRLENHEIHEKSHS